MKDSSSFRDVTVPKVLSTYAVTIVAILWIGFAIALVANRAWLDIIWQWVRALPLVPEIIVWLVFLPILVGLWIWQSAWSTPVNLVALAGMLVWTYAAISAFVKAWFHQAGGIERSV